jgi:hypothetical protein
MRAAAEYRKHAEECRRLAQHTTAPEDKRALEELAEAWETLAKLGDGQSKKRTSRILGLINQRKSLS